MVTIWSHRIDKEQGFMGFYSQNKIGCDQAMIDVFIGIKWCPGADSNHRHEDFQSTALPTELPGHTEPLKYAPGHKKPIDEHLAWAYFLLIL